MKFSTADTVIERKVGDSAGGKLRIDRGDYVVERRGPADVNRQAFSLIANLGFVPPDVPFAALEIS